MRNALIELVESRQVKKSVPSFDIGDTVDVSVKIVEGEKERIQVFSGTVIARKGAGISQVFTVRRIVNDEGVERIFPLHSPSIVDVKVRRHGQARRAKLYFLRDRVGKAVRLKERQEGRPGVAAPAAPTAPAATAASAPAASGGTKKG